jgi:diguanylate cyclase (GGDEF)-like protein
MVLLAHDRMAERLERLANRDELTGALTRRAFVAQAGVLIETARVKATPVVLAIVDIDHFKAINDHFGHAAGDRALAHFGRVVATGVRDTDLFGRMGGEEFALLFPAITREAAVMRLDALRVAALAVRRGGDTAQAERDQATPHAGLTFSAGLDMLQPGDTLASLMARADAALYEAKTRGRDRVVSAQSAQSPQSAS